MIWLLDWFLQRKSLENSVNDICCAFHVAIVITGVSISPIHPETSVTAVAASKILGGTIETVCHWLVALLSFVVDAVDDGLTIVAANWARASCSCWCQRQSSVLLVSVPVSLKGHRRQPLWRWRMSLISFGNNNYDRSSSVLRESWPWSSTTRLSKTPFKRPIGIVLTSFFRILSLLLLF